MIKLQFIGNLGHDAIRREVNGASVLNFSAAHTYRFKDQHGVQQERTTWVDCAYWERTNVGPHLTTGTQVYLEGIPSLEAYVTNSGEPAAGLKLRVTNLQLLGRRREGPRQFDDDIKEINDAASAADDLPF
ncbi:single-strand DNA-binding protein [Chitinophaga sp. CF118]|uniref:single-stranded DNA-binding protein n=1 Tax=Chitinophaga sp. CF118 TaxID=1884367 RepID=UPI0008EE0312|nr:single-stranded DNA-binding protein [Chitinophaga sp. CF118]SFD05144.1 single-strand DNA-binding protein [Chitinophaga sp. CF118]